MARSLLIALLLTAMAASVACGGGDDDDDGGETPEASPSAQRGSPTPRPTADAELITPEGTAAAVDTPAPVADTPVPAAPTSPPAPPPPAPAPTEAPPPPPPPPAATTLPIVAEGIAFTQLATTAPAGDVTIIFDNRAAGIPHNVHFFAGPAATSASLAMTPIAPGPVQQTLGLGPLAAGGYFYRCDVHPAQMSGTLTVS